MELLKMQLDILEAQSLVKQGPPGPPPRPGLRWNWRTHRWIHPKDAQQSQGGEGEMPGGR